MTTILSVIDTRQYEEQGDRWVPIPGSGNARDCDRCRRSHEVHATVRYLDGRTAVVGTGCMGLGPEAARRAASRASTVARLRAALRKYEAERESACEVRAWAEELVPPAIVDADPAAHCGIPGIVCGDSWVAVHLARGPHELEERRALVVILWRADRRDERAGRRVRDLYRIEYDISDTLRRLALAEEQHS